MAERDLTQGAESLLRGMGNLPSRAGNSQRGGKLVEGYSDRKKRELQNKLAGIFGKQGIAICSNFQLHSITYIEHWAVKHFRATISHIDPRHIWQVAMVMIVAYDHNIGR